MPNDIPEGITPEQNAYLQQMEDMQNRSSAIQAYMAGRNAEFSTEIEALKMAKNAFNKIAS